MPSSTSPEFMFNNPEITEKNPENTCNSEKKYSTTISELTCGLVSGHCFQDTLQLFSLVLQS